MTTARWKLGKGIFDATSNTMLIAAHRKKRRFQRQLAISLWEKTTMDQYVPTPGSPLWYPWKKVPDRTEPNTIQNIVVLVGLDHEILEIYWGSDENKARKYFKQIGWKHFGSFWRKS